MLTNRTTNRPWTWRKIWRMRVLHGSVGTMLILACSTALHAQGSPLTIQPSTSRVGVNTTNPGYPLDVNGTINATSFRGDGSQLTNLPSSGGAILGGYGSRGQTSANNTTTPNTQYDLKADVVILYKTSDQTTLVRHNPGTITNNVSTAGPAANGRDQAGAFSASSWIHFYCGGKFGEIWGHWGNLGSGLYS